MPQESEKLGCERENKSHKGEESRFATIKIESKTATLLKVYCAVNDWTISAYATDLIERELENFRKKVEEIKRLGAGE